MLYAFMFSSNFLSKKKIANIWSLKIIWGKRKKNIKHRTLTRRENKSVNSVNMNQQVANKTIPKKKKCKKAKWLSEEALPIAEKGKEVKSKGVKKRYTHLNAEFQRIAKKDKKAFLSDQCKEIEENNRMGKLEISSRKLEILRE